MKTCASFLLSPCRLPLFCLWIVAAPLALADIYKHVDEQGNITFTNTPLKGAQRIYIESTYSAPVAVPRQSKARSADVATRNTTPATFPRVNAGMQKERDVSRRRILEDELASEKRQLSSKQKELAEANSNRTPEEIANPQKYVERLGRLRENVMLHEKNVVALQTELSKVR